MELILTAMAVLFAETLVLCAFERRAERRWERFAEKSEKPRASDEGFWQNIISYDHKKGGEKE